MEIRPLTRATITDPEATELARVKTLAHASRLPSDPPISPEYAKAMMLGSTKTYVHDYFGLFDDERLVGFSESGGSLTPENLEVASVGIWIDPAAVNPDGSGEFDLCAHHRLFEHVCEVERSRGRTRFWGWGSMDDAATRQFWEGELQYELALDERISRCDLTAVDADLMQQWIDRAAERAGGYHLVKATPPMNDEAIAFYAQGLEAMNDAPLDDLDFTDEKFDIDRAREIEWLQSENGSVFRAIFAVETATNELAGYTATRVHPKDPTNAHQSDTATISEHRNKGLGRWLKAEMWQWLRADEPQATMIDTENAESNAAMLAINEAMGFEDALHHGVWHLPTSSNEHQA